MTRVYLWATAAGLPAALLFRTFNALNVAISRPRVVMWVNLAGVATKVPLNWLFMGGSDAIGLPAMGGAGCGVATAVLAWSTALVAAAILALDRRYALFEVARWSPPRSKVAFAFTPRVSVARIPSQARRSKSLATSP